MRKILYQQPHVIVRVINPEELLQLEINSGEEPITGEEGEAKFLDFDDADNYGFNSDDIWED